MTNKPAIDMQDIHVAFDGEQVLDGFSLQIPHGSKYTVTGQSGTGKSTILKVLMGFIVPDHGTVRICGEKLEPGTIWEIRRKVCYVAQEPELGEGTVDDILKRPFSFKANSGIAIHQDTIERMLHRLNLPAGILSKDISSLSGGEKQRVAIVGALLLDRPVYLLDEPTSALDDENTSAMLEYLKTLKEKTFLTVAHNLRDNSFSHQMISLNLNREHADDHR